MADNKLYEHPYFTARVERMTPDERIALAYKRAQLVVRTYNLSLDDIQYCTSKFWSLFFDPICARDGGMFTILAAHIGLTVGSLSRHVRTRPDLKPLVDRLLRFETCGIYLLSERAHGLDAFNVETTATKVADGYILNTPREEAAKMMPASTPLFGIPKVALVNAKLIVDGKDKGARFFIVPICTEKEMYKGVHSTRLPPRGGSSPLDFSITSFHNVHLPPGAIVAGDANDTSRPENVLEAWWDEVWRIQLGTMAVPAMWISGTRKIAYILGKYSQHRALVGKGDSPIPIISFRTQQWPVAHATAVATVMRDWYPKLIDYAMDPSRDHRVRHALSVIVKATAIRHFQRCVQESGERAGAQGTFEPNYFIKVENDAKGVVIAEGDILTLCIRLFSELLLERYNIPLPDSNSSLLARHAASRLEENKALLKSLKKGHRDPAFNSLVLPSSEPVVEAIGHALAYESGVKAGLPKAILDVYESAVIRLDQAWYSEKANLNRLQQLLKEDKAVTSLIADLPKHLDALEIEDYVQAPIVSDAAWKSYLYEIPVFTGSAVASEPHYEALRGQTQATL